LASGEPTPSDDLSGGANSGVGNDDPNKNLFKDATARRHYRTAATCAAFVVLACLIYFLHCVTTALVRDIAFIEPPAVAVATALVVAITVLSIALLRSTFAPTPDPNSKKGHESESSVTSTAAEAIKALRDALESVLDVLKKKS
jgi:hypothetical protein